MKLLALGCVCLVPTACAVQRPIRPQAEIVDRPPLKQIVEADIGETLVAKGKLYIYPAVELIEEATVTQLVATRRLEPQTLVGRSRDRHWQYYFGTVLLGGVREDGGVAVPLNDNDQLAFEGVSFSRPLAGNRARREAKHLPKVFVAIGNSTTKLTPDAPLALKESSVIAENAPNFRQELIYNGRTGNAVRFLYRELQGGLLRFPFTQEAQYDLGESQVIGFKGLRLEVLDATNTRIRYRVLKPFQDHQEE